MLPLKIRCQNCGNKGELKDKRKFSPMGKYEGYSVSACLQCGQRLVYIIPVFKRYGLMAVGLLFISWGIFQSITADSGGMNKFFGGFMMGSIFLLASLNSEVKVKKTFRKEELPGTD
jgi:rRNA maturation protein Nop10